MCAFIYLDKIKNAKKVIISMQVQQKNLKKVCVCCEKV